MQAQELRISQFFPKTASEQDYDELIDLQLQSFQERNPGDKLPPRELLYKQLELLDDNPLHTLEFLQVRNADGRLEAMYFMGFPREDSPDYEEQKHMGMVSIFVHPQARRQGIGRLILSKIIERFQEKGVSLIQGDVPSDAGRSFAKKFAGKVALESKTSRAYINAMNWQMLEAWVQESVTANPDVKLEYYEGLPPDADLDAYCKLMTELNSQQPLGELEGVETTFTPENMREMLAQQHERGIQEFVMISREANGEISGMSEIIYNDKRPHLIQQGLTGVRQSYRGRNLGKWLKAAMLLHIRETYPELQYIDTTNATVNEAMLSINERVGFKLHRHNSLFKLTVADAAQLL